MTYFLGWIVSVVFLAPQFSLHLEANILKVNLASCVISNVALGYVVLRMLPVMTATEARQLLPVLIPQHANCWKMN